jgi:transposase-like protein
MTRNEFPRHELPPPTTKRWVARRKAAVVAAVLTGVITVEEACRRYQLSEEEFLAWQRAFEAHGLRGLSATRMRYYHLRHPQPVKAPIAADASE